MDDGRMEDLSKDALVSGPEEEEEEGEENSGEGDEDAVLRGAENFYES